MSEQRLLELERADAARDALERGAQRLEGYPTNEKYRAAFKKAARMLREMIGTKVPVIGNDNGQQDRHE